MNLISLCNFLAFLIFLCSIAMTIYAVAKKSLYSISGLFLIICLLAFAFNTFANVLEHVNYTAVFDVYEEYFEILIVPYFLIFIYSISSQNEILSRKKNEKLLAETLKDREAMLSELHHRIMNNLQTFSSILTLQKTFLHDNNARQQIEETAKRVLIMGLFHKKLYQSQNFSNIDFKDFISSIVDEIKTKNESKTAPIEFHVDIQEIQTNIDTAIICGLIIYEIVSNSINHAFNGRDHCIIGITASALENNLNKLTVYDNGTGLPDAIDLNKNHGLGLLIIKMLAEQLEGSVAIERKDGTEYTIMYQKMLKEEKRWQKSE